MITQKTKYALKSLMALGALEPGTPLTIEEVAQRSGAPKRFLEHILLDLRKSGYLGAKRGRAGGYFLIREPAKISLGELLQQIDGPIAPLPCLSRRAYRRCEDCDDEQSCQLRRVFGEVFYSYLLLIESLTLQDLLKDPVMAAKTFGTGTAEAAARENGSSREPVAGE
ncbi:RrF2 family transcriptional regulator [Salipiger mangrovisoli]|uniref:Rrf2 family transcriptional regulator n=1 Tax=Salipiger mangrovisoli TaxID=2865933 RepID=A0ABR9X509_9RHOB|nr:Rrf2 family transcriptional regulator [Salipiger mangrovisoli]MBE9638683.1 Rrf2 family transcriptional regulator [Salipiger mangrovisoli]